MVIIMNLKRNIEEVFLEYNKMFKTVLITGPRQVGKTTFLKNIKEKARKYVTLDDLEIRKLANENPKEFLSIYKPPMIIDEIQYAPKLLSYIKIACDNTKEKGLFWLTGSQKIELMKNVSESLAGRMGVLDMTSFTNRELCKSKLPPYDLEEFTNRDIISKDKLLDLILKGGMPEYLTQNIKREYFFSSYVNLYLERDIRELKQIEDLNAFYTFLVSVASRACQVLNYASIARDTRKDNKTVKSWLSILEATGIIKLIYPLRKEELKRITSQPKIIFMDSGLCTYLLGINTKKALTDYTNFGFLFENYIISEMLKTNSNYSLGNTFSYYRDKDGNEIDLIIKDYDNIYHPFEIKYRDNVNVSMISSFNKIKNLKNVGKGGIICNEKNVKKLTDTHDIIPISSVIV